MFFLIIMEKKIIILHALMAFMPLCAGAHADNAQLNGNERLSRGLVVLPSGSGQFVSWRMLATDGHGTTFDILRDGVAVKKGLATATSWTDVAGGPHSEYRVVTNQPGALPDTSAVAMSWSRPYMKLPLDRPAGGVTPDGKPYSYTPNDCSVGDVDGDGEYEIILKWDPTNSKDNAPDGYTGSVVLDCYRMDGTRLWRVDLGRNIRAGAHYTQFMVYDLDGDGKAEMVCKTAPGSIGGDGRFVTEAATLFAIKGADNTADYRNAKGRILSGPEYLTVFDGETGRAIHTIYYTPNRAGATGGAPEHPSEDFWGDEHGNRGERYLACVAYLGGLDHNPSVVMCRGYYSMAYLWAVDFNGSRLATRWLHASLSKNRVQHTDAAGKKTMTTHTTNTMGLKNGSNTVYGNGNHNISVADVDGDGCDEIIYGSAAVDNDGSLLYATGCGHGDAMHLADLDPDRPGLEVFEIHEDGVAGYGWDVHDAATGEILLNGTSGGDNGRGMAADITDESRGHEFWSAADKQARGIDGSVVGSNGGSYTFRIYWDGDLYDEQLGDISNHNSPYLEKYGKGRIKINGKNVYEIDRSRTCNSTKGTPCLTADLFGDWREEMVFWCGTDSASLNIFTTTEPTAYRVPTLMHDHVYRMGVAWQNVAYNQPPHLGYWLPGRFDGTASGIRNATAPAVQSKRVYGLDGVLLGTALDGLPAGLYIVREMSATGRVSAKKVLKE